VKTEPRPNEAREALIKALKRVGIQLGAEDADGGLVMHELRKLGFRIRKMARGDFEGYRRRRVPKAAE